MNYLPWILAFILMYRIGSKLEALSEDVACIHRELDKYFGNETD